MHKANTMMSKEQSEDLREQIVSKHKSEEGHKAILAAWSVLKHTEVAIVWDWKQIGSTKTLCIHTRNQTE